MSGAPMKNLGPVPVDAIRALSALEVGERLGILTQDVENPQSGRYAFKGADTSTWLQFYDDGTFFNHRNGKGGTGIDLVLQYLAGGPDWLPDQSRFVEACRMIQEAFNLAPLIDSHERRNEDLARILHEHGIRTARAVARAVVKDQPQFEQNRREINRLMEALDLSHYSLAVLSFEKGAFPAFSPAVPWQGERVLSKEVPVDSDGNTYRAPGGWTKQRALEYWDDADSGRILALDFDGGDFTEHTQDAKSEDTDQQTKRRVLPKKALVDRLIRELERTGLIPAAIVISSFHGQANDRVKAHAYFRAAERATTVEEYEAWHGELDERVDRAIRSMKLSGVDAASLARDPATHQVTRLMRLPGFPKAGADHAAVVIYTDRSARIDFRDLIETRPVTTEWMTRSFPSHASLTPNAGSSSRSKAKSPSQRW